MPQLTHLTASALAIAAILLLPGCTGDAPIVLPSPESSTAPVFATDEEALAAAEVAYGEYLEASNAITGKKAADPQDIAPHIHPEYLPEILDSIQDLREKRLHSSGPLTVDSVTLQQYEDDLQGPVTVAVYLCVDASNARLLNESKEDVTPANRADRVPLEVTFESEERTSNLLMKSSDMWTGDDFCES